jgi:hypothetical protein
LEQKSNFSLWVDQVTPKTTISQGAYTLVYETRFVLPIHLQILALRLAITEGEGDFHPLQNWLETFIELKELREYAFQHLQKKK